MPVNTVVVPIAPLACCLQTVRLNAKKVVFAEIAKKCTAKKQKWTILSPSDLSQTGQH